MYRCALILEYISAEDIELFDVQDGDSQAIPNSHI